MTRDFDVAGDHLSAQPHNCRSYSEKKTSHHIEQHLYSLDIDKGELRVTFNL